MSYDLWGRLRYMLSPQFDIYEQVAEVVSGFIADIGSGTGFGTHLLSRNSTHVWGFECDESALSFSIRTFSNGTVSFKHGDITHAGGNYRVGDYSPVDNGGYDFITMIDVIEHIEESYKAFFHCNNILCDNGKFICSTPNRLSRYRKSEYHVREYSPDELKELLETVFDYVQIVDYQLKPMESEYINPILAICRRGVKC